MGSACPRVRPRNLPSGRSARGFPTWSFRSFDRRSSAVFSEPVRVMPRVELRRARSARRAHALPRRKAPRILASEAPAGSASDRGHHGFGHLDGEAALRGLGHSRACHHRRERLRALHVSLSSSREERRARAFASRRPPSTDRISTFGLEHCPVRGCLMEDGGGSVLTADRERDLCPSCRKELGARGVLRAPPGSLALVALRLPRAPGFSSAPGSRASCRQGGS